MRFLNLKQLRRIITYRNNNKNFYSNEYCLNIFYDLVKHDKKKLYGNIILCYLLNFSGNSIKIEKINGFLISYKKSIYSKDIYIVVRKTYRNFFVDILLNLNSPTYYHLEII